MPMSSDCDVSFQISWEQSCFQDPTIGNLHWHQVQNSKVWLGGTRARCKHLPPACNLATWKSKVKEKNKSQEKVVTPCKEVAFIENWGWSHWWCECKWCFCCRRHFCKGTALTKNKNPGIAELRMTSVFFLNKQWLLIIIWYEWIIVIEAWRM